MRYSYLKLQELLATENISEKKLVKLISEISYNFTKVRSKISLYTDNDEYVVAYSSYYLPTNLKKLSAIFSLLNVDLCHQITKRPFIDFGTGPGTYLLALLEQFPSYELPLIGVDQSPSMLKYAKKILTHFYPEKKIHFQQNLLNLPKEATLFLGHSLNEMEVEEFCSLVEKNSPATLMILDIGTKECFAKIKDLAQNLIFLGYIQHFPCPGNSCVANCPMQTSDWCHFKINLVHEPELERLSQLVSLDRKVMPYLFHVYVHHSLINPNQIPSTPSFGLQINSKIVGRIIEIEKETKFSIFVRMRFKDYRQPLDKNVLLRVEFFKKGFSKEEWNFFRQFGWGKLFEIELLKIIDSDYVRAKIMRELR